MLDCKLIDTHMHSNVKLLPDQGEIFSDPGRYIRLVGKLNYLTMTKTRYFICSHCCKSVPEFPL